MYWTGSKQELIDELDATARWYHRRGQPQTWLELISLATAVEIGQMTPSEAVNRASYLARANPNHAGGR